MLLTGSPEQHLVCMLRAVCMSESPAERWHRLAPTSRGVQLPTAAQCRDVCAPVGITQEHKRYCSMRRKIKFIETPGCNSVMRDGDWNEYRKKTEKKGETRKNVAALGFSMPYLYFYTENWIRDAIPVLWMRATVSGYTALSNFIFNFPILKYW